MNNAFMNKFSNACGCSSGFDGTGSQRPVNTSGFTQVNGNIVVVSLTVLAIAALIIYKPKFKV
jgi:hypothetical protein